MASEIQPRHPHGPYIILQTGYVPGDLGMRAADYLLGRSGEWLAVYWFLRMPVHERRTEFLFGTMTEVVTMMEELCGVVKVLTGVENVGHDSPVDEEWHGVIIGG